MISMNKRRITRIVLQLLSTIFAIFSILYFLFAAGIAYILIVNGSSLGEIIIGSIFAIFILLFGAYLSNVAYKMIKHFSRDSVKHFSFLLSLALFSVLASILKKHNPLNTLQEKIYLEPNMHDLLELAIPLVCLCGAILFYSIIKPKLTELAFPSESKE